jgi:hypothetical protein
MKRSKEMNNDAVTVINVQNIHIQVQEEKLPYIIPNQVPFLSQIKLLILFSSSILLLRQKVLKIPKVYHLSSSPASPTLSLIGGISSLFLANYSFL